MFPETGYEGDYISDGMLLHNFLLISDGIMCAYRDMQTQIKNLFKAQYYDCKSEEYVS
jgi:hypothetical protein